MARTTDDHPATEQLPTLAHLADPSAPEHVRLAVIADPHVSPRAEGTPKLYHRSELRLETAFRDVNSRNVDAVLSVGDLTKDGAPWEFDRFDELLAILDAPFVAVPGNHDVRKTMDDWVEDDDRTPTETGVRRPLDRFEAAYTPGELPFCTSVGPVDIVGLNTASMPDGSLRESHGGALSEAELAWLDRTLGEAENPIVCCHHNTPGVTRQLDEFSARLPDGGPMPPTEEWSFFISNAEAFLEVLESHDVELVLTGHLHVPAIGRAKSIREITVPSTGSYPNASLLLDIGPTGTTVRYVPLVGPAGSAESNAARRNGTELSLLLERFSAAQLASFPLVVEASGETDRARQDDQRPTRQTN